MRNLFMALVVALMATLMIGGTAFAQSQPAPPAGPPQVDNAIVDRLTAAESDAASALRQAREALRRLDAAEAEITELRSRRPTRVAPAPTSPAPASPAPVPANSADDRLDAVGTDIETLTRRIGALTAAVIGAKRDDETSAQYSERVALALTRLSDPGLTAKVEKIETDVATLTGIVREHGAKIERGFRATVGIEGVLDAGTPIEGVRPGFLSQGGLALALGHGFTGKVQPAVDLVAGTGVGMASTYWYVGGRGTLAVPSTPVEVGSQVTVGQYAHGFRLSETTGASGVETRVTPALYVGVRKDTGPTFGFTVGRGAGPSWTTAGESTKVGTLSGVTATFGGGWSF